MKYLLITFLLCNLLTAQELIIDPIGKKTTILSSDDSRIIFSNITGNNSTNTPGHMQMHMQDEESYEYFTITEDGGVRVSKFEEDFETKVDFNGLSIFNRGAVLYKISIKDGFQAFDANGNSSVQIQGNVSGDGRVTTNELELTGGSDLSEHFDIKNPKSHITPGLLVSIADDQGRLQITNEKRDKKIVGIISGANGIETGLLMGQKGSIADGDYPIALTGRTYVHATNENGSIKAGDFLTSSSIPGYAMKVRKIKKAQGAIIGKAMTKLEKENGFVLVLVNLQ